MHYRLLPFAFVMALACVATNSTHAQTAKLTAPPPKFAPAHLRPFAQDVRSLVGPGKPGSIELALADENESSNDRRRWWPNAISADSIERELRFQQACLSEATKNVTAFKSGGSVRARNALLMMASIYAVLPYYDDEAPWKKEGEGLQQLCTQTGNGCKTSSDNAYQTAIKTIDQLKRLRDAESVKLPPLDPDARGGAHITASPLMRRLELSDKEHLVEWTSDAATFKRRQSDLVVEGEVVAFVGKYLLAPGIDPAGAQDYSDWAMMLSKSGSDLASAAKASDRDKALAAITVMRRACVDCHAAYR
jgi:hypothetical protein